MLNKSYGASWVMILIAVRNAVDGSDRHRCFKNSNPARAYVIWSKACLERSDIALPWGGLGEEYIPSSDQGCRY